ncbi:hypothetical protein [Salipiger pallidus]|uniref:hypothetical protein n=1 Tax=Salipiger pallidus TaxID=1775170 RepID=UPI001E2E9D5D|nr:hypothetical protein [Salipiger pallidus]
MPFLGTTTRALLLPALIGTSIVPTGFMRASSPEEMSLVICTGGGPQEITVDASGETVPTMILVTCPATINAARPAFCQGSCQRSSPISPSPGWRGRRAT